MKSHTRLICLLLALLLFAAMALGSSSTEETKPIIDSTTAPANNGTAVPSTPAPTQPQDNDAVIQEQLLFDKDGIKVTANAYVTDSIWGDGIKLLIENNSDRTISIGCKTLIVNNYMISDLFSATVAAGKKSNEILHFSSTELEAAGIQNIGQIELYLYVYDSDSYKTIFEADPVTIKTSLYDKMDTTPNDSGKELYNKNGIRIVGKYVDENSFWGNSILLYVENNSDNNISIFCEDLSINGFMITGYFSCKVFSGKMAIDEIGISSTDLKENDITEIADIELSFRIRNADSFEVIDETDPIKFSVG